MQSHPLLLSSNIISSAAVRLHTYVLPTKENPPLSPTGHASSFASFVCDIISSRHQRGYRSQGHGQIPVRLVRIS